MSTMPYDCLSSGDNGMDRLRCRVGVVAMGSLTPSGTFEANQVLAKHDEKYMPPEVVDALKRSGRWKEAGGSR